MKRPKVSVIIPNYNGEKLLRKNLSSLANARENKQNNIKEIIIVDNGSRDASKKLVKENYPIIKFISLDRNYGFSYAVNRGVENSSGNLILLLNNDVKVSKKFLEPVFKHFKDEKVFGVSLHEKGYGWSIGGFENGFIVHKPGKETSRPHETFWVGGSSGVFRKRVWDKLDGLDEDLLSPFYWEDIDIGYRAQKRGYKLVWEPDAHVVHKHASTASVEIRKDYLRRIQERNQLLFIWKNLTSKKLINTHLSGILKRILRGLGYTRVLLMALPRLPLAIRKRKIEINESNVTDETILNLK
jgi:GT2 family glycosyltransferase